MAAAKAPARKRVAKDVDPADAFLGAALLAATRFAPLLKALERY